MSAVNHQAAQYLVTEVPVIDVTKTVGEAEKHIRLHAESYKTINYVYLINGNKELVGVASLRELFMATHETPLSLFQNNELITARLHTDQERVAHLAISHNLKAVPILSPTKEFLGVIPSDAILGILNREHTEDVLRLAGVNNSTDMQQLAISTSAATQIMSRLPWLMLGLGGGILAAFVVENFEETLAEQLMLAAFIPAVVYLADAVGTQTEMIFIRALTMNPNLNLTKYIAKEGCINIVLAIILATVFAGASFLWLDSLVVSMVLGISILLTVCVTVSIAIAMPLLFHKLHRDPAIASGPLTTVICDVLSLCIYLLVAGAFVL